MVNGEVVNGANSGVCHVTGITHDNKCDSRQYECTTGKRTII